MNSTGIQMVVCDLDGTLLTDDHVIHPRTRRAIERIREAGILFGVASGRRPQPTSRRFEDWGLAGIVDIFVGENGGNTVDFRSGLTIEGEKLQPETVQALISHFSGLPVVFALAEDDRSVLDKDNALAAEFARLDEQEYVIHDFSTYVTHPVGKLTVVFDPADSVRVLTRAAEFPFPEVRMVQTHDLLVEFHHRSITKARGLAELVRAEGFSLSDVVAFGDNDNDAEMLAEVGWGVAMGHASVVAPAASDEVIGTNNSDAIAVWLEGFFELAPTSEVLAELEDTAVRVALECGRLIRDDRPADVRVADTKSSTTDIVTLMDRRSEELARSLLTAWRPNDGLMGEEGLSRPSQTGITWVIDPIDGTVNYLYGIEEYAVSVAAVVGDPHRTGGWWPVAGAVYHPIRPDVRRAPARARGAGDSETRLVVRRPRASRRVSSVRDSAHEEIRRWQGALISEVLPG